MKIALFLDENSQEKEIGAKSIELFVGACRNLGYEYEVVLRPSMKDVFLNSYTQFDLGIPVIHGGYGEGGHITAMLTLLEIPYLFSDSDAHAMCFNKYLSNLLVQDMGYVVPFTFHIHGVSDCKYIQFDGPYFVKPNKSGSSLGCGIYNTIQEATPLIEDILCYDTVLIQKLVRGREFTVSLTGTAESAKVLGIMEILTEKDFFDYDAKYRREKTKEIFPVLEDDLKTHIEETSKSIYKKMGLKDVARIDYIYTNNVLYFLEVNTIPGMTAMSFFPQCIKHFGYKSFEDFLQELIDQKQMSPQLVGVRKTI